MLRAKNDRALAWGRLVVARSSIPVLAAEAKRRGLGPSALMADIIDRWCTAIGQRCLAEEHSRSLRLSGLHPAVMAVAELVRQILEAGLP